MFKTTFATLLVAQAFAAKGGNGGGGGGGRGGGGGETTNPCDPFEGSVCDTAS